MEPTLTTWLAIPAVGGVIGYVTNRLAVRMLFRPVKPVRILGLRLQGLIPRRQADIAKSIGHVVGTHLLRHDDIARGLSRLDLEKLVGDALDTGLAPKIAELRGLPLIGGFLTDDRIQDLRRSVLKGVMANKERLFASLEKALESDLDVHELVESKVAAFPVHTLEDLVLQVARRELRAIEILGGVLGVIIGLGQVALLYLIA
ncbi:MAG: DUF445 family protein [Planctomycetes bacterium]|nr:DUF445 family protein [Planctomycetota bacterium]